jgi:hypothetical protein
MPVPVIVFIALPELALLVALPPVIVTFRFQRLLAAPLPPPIVRAGARVPSNPAYLDSSCRSSAGGL